MFQLFHVWKLIRFISFHFLSIRKYITLLKNFWHHKLLNYINYYYLKFPIVSWTNIRNCRQTRLNTISRESIFATMDSNTITFTNIFDWTWTIRRKNYFYQSWDKKKTFCDKLHFVNFLALLIFTELSTESP